jgi:hypothetical protein
VLTERLRIDELEQLANQVESKMEMESQERNRNLINVTSPRSSTISQDENNFLKRRKMLRKRLSTLKIDEESARIANESLMSPLVDSTENLTRVMAELKQVLNASKKMNPSLLLLMCELKGWMAPVQWNIKQCMKELAGTDNVEEDNTSRKLSFFRPVDNGFVDGAPSSNDSATPSLQKKGSLNKVAPGGEQNTLTLSTTKDVAANEHKVDSLKVGTEQEQQEEGGASMKSDEPLTPRMLDMSPPPEGSRGPQTPQSSGFLSAIKLKHHSITPQQSLTPDAASALKDYRSPSGRSIEVNLTTNKKGITRGHSFAIKMVRAAPDIANKGTAEAFSRKMDRALDNPNSCRTRLWLLLEFPHSSKGARILQLFLLFIILLSVLMLYTQTVPSFGSYGESSDICGKVLHVYCPNKHNNTLDPGCFVHNINGTTTEKLRYDCNDDDCFGSGYNFGAVNTNVSCVDGQPFETSEQLASNFRMPDFLVGRDEMHKIHDVCLRIECTAVVGGVNGNFVWIPVEIFVSICFTLEIFLRIIVADSFYHFCWDFLNIFDMLSVVPFYIDVIQVLVDSTPLDFRILSSSPEPVLLVAMKSFKVFRLFKMTRHFSASKVLFETANKALTQILGIISLLLFIVLMFALFLFEVEKGTPCYVGDADCELPEENDHEYGIGQRVLINKVGDVSAFKTVLESMWFSMVTLTSVGYGDLAPITNLGQLISIVLMLFGAIYLAMPLTVAAATFWSVHQAYVDGNKKKQIKEKKLVSAKFCKKISSLEKSFTNVTKMLQDFFADIQAPDTSGEQRKGNLPLFQRCLQVESSLRSALKKHDGDIRRLSAFAISNKEQLMKAKKE